MYFCYWSSEHEPSHLLNDYHTLLFGLNFNLILLLASFGSLIIFSFSINLLESYDFPNVMHDSFLLYALPWECLLGAGSSPSLLYLRTATSVSNYLFEIKLIWMISLLLNPKCEVLIKIQIEIIFAAFGPI